MLSDEQLDAMFKECYPEGKHYGRMIEQAVRNATLEEVAQMMEKHPPKVRGRALYKYWVDRLRQMKEGK